MQANQIFLFKKITIPWPMSDPRNTNIPSYKIVLPLPLKKSP